MAQQDIDINQVDYKVYEAIIQATLADYKNSYNQKNPDRQVDFHLTLSPATLRAHDLLIKQGKTKEELEKNGVENTKFDVRYFRLAKFFVQSKYSTPIIAEFKTGFVYQQLDKVNKVWEELQFQEGDTPPTQDLLDAEEVRVEKRIKEGEIVIHQQSIHFEKKEEVLREKWWKRILYLDLLNTLLAKGIEYGEVLGLIQKQEEEKAVLAKELGESAKQVLEANDIVIRKHMPDPLSKEDEAYKKKIGKMRRDEGINDE